MVASHGAELLPEVILAMKKGVGLKGVHGLVYPYPTRGEAIARVAGEWRNKRRPEKTLKYMEMYHRFRRRI